MINILWTSNIVLPEALELLSGTKQSSLKSSGGWMIGMLGGLSKHNDIHIYVASASKMVSDLTRLEGERLTYYLLPNGNQDEPKTVDDGKYDKYFVRIKEEINPDIVDIHGTEYVFCSSCLRVFGSERTVVTLQGLLSECGKNYYNGLSLKVILSNSRLFEGNVINDAKKFLKRAECEDFVLRNSNKFIGRTLWDKAHVMAVNPQATYFHCDDILRDEFYEGCWRYENCTPYRIFISSGDYPIKGLHEFLKALPIVCQKFPETTVYVGGWRITRGRLADIGNYARILRKQIESQGLEQYITFTGPLDAIQMKEQYLAANVFVLPSTIENGSNSLSEAQMLGVPCVASCVGGISDTIPDRNCGMLYTFGDNVMLAQAIIDAFENKTFDNTHMRQVAHKRHDIVNNVECLLNIYKSVCNGDT